MNPDLWQIIEWLDSFQDVVKKAFQVREICLENNKSGTAKTVTSPSNKNMCKGASTVGNVTGNLRKWKRRSGRKLRE
jgi:hypothetical protein